MILEMVRHYGAGCFMWAGLAKLQARLALHRVCVLHLAGCGGEHLIRVPAQDAAKENPGVDICSARTTIWLKTEPQSAARYTKVLPVTCRSDEEAGPRAERGEIMDLGGKDTLRHGIHELFWWRREGPERA